MQKSHTLLTTVGLSAALSLFGCASENNPYQSEEYQTASNPASVYCVESGGSLEMLTLDHQRSTFCVLKNGVKVEQWEYYKQNHSQSVTNSTE